MSALEIIEQIKSLPPEEKAQVVSFIHEIEADPTESSKRSSVDRVMLEATAEKVFDRYDDLFRKLAQ